MKICDTCGSEIEDRYPFVACPQCLLFPIEQKETATGVSWAGGVLASNVFPKRDFFEKYELTERVGIGGQGEVWKTWDYELRRYVAMKRLANGFRNSDAELYRFLAEAQITSQLEHRGILPILDMGLDPDDRPYYTTSLLAGLTLQDVWQTTGERGHEEWPLHRKIDLLASVCDILAFAHDWGVIHRDLKPQNILVGPFGDVRVVDWGAAYVMAQDQPKFEALGFLDWEEIETTRVQEIWTNPSSPLATETAGQPITIVFAPPEILAGCRDRLGPTTDVYAVGIMLYELLTGVLPYLESDGKHPKPRTLRDIIIKGPPPAVSTLRPGVSRDLAAVCAKAMAHNDRARYQTVSELAEVSGHGCPLRIVPG